MLQDYSRQRELTFYVRGTHRQETVLADSFEQGRSNAAYLLSVDERDLVFLPQLPPLGSVGTSVKCNERVVVTGPDEKGEAGLVIEVKEVEHSTSPSHRVRIGTREIWFLECNIAPSCELHRSVEARWKCPLSPSGFLFYCEQCAVEMNYFNFSQPLWTLQRYEPMSGEQRTLILAWREYCEQGREEGAHDRMPCIICCQVNEVCVLSEFGVCPTCISQQRRIPGWLYDFIQSDGERVKQVPIEQLIVLLREKYTALEVHYERSHYWSTEHIAYHQIGTALQSPHPVQALQKRIEKAQGELAKKEQMLLDGLFQGDPEGFRTYYRTLMALFTTVLQEFELGLVIPRNEASLDSGTIHNCPE